jgi:glycosyltransferase involved in cell wall biosynthesis
VRVTVVVTSYEDPRIEATLACLADQSRAPDQVLVADGSLDDDFRAWLDDQADEHGAQVVHEADASVARARNLALEAATGDVLAFLDTDQRAPEPWLERLVAPIEAGRADWTGGPTRPIAELEVVALKEARLYEAARRDPTRIPMGNSAWRRGVFEAVGGFDERLHGGGEDWDLALRARAAGLEGTLVEDAWVEHDLTGLDSHWTLAKKQFRYNVGGAMAYLKNDALGDRADVDLPPVERHPFDLLEPVLKAAALPVAWWRLKRAPEPEAPADAGEGPGGQT